MLLHYSRAGDARSGRAQEMGSKRRRGRRTALDEPASDGSERQRELRVLGIKVVIIASFGVVYIVFGFVDGDRFSGLSQH